MTPVDETEGTGQRWEGAEEDAGRGGGRWCIRTEITKACVCVSSVVSAPLHKIPPFLPFPEPSWLPAPPTSRLIGQAAGSLQTQTGFSPQLGGSADSLLRGGGGGGVCAWSGALHPSHFSGRGGQEMIGSASAGLSQGSSSPLVSTRLPAASMSSSSANLHNKRLPCKSLSLTQSCLFR